MELILNGLIWISIFKYLLLTILSKIIVVIESLFSLKGKFAYSPINYDFTYANKKRA
jgi:hypothetical protein